MGQTRGSWNRKFGTIGAAQRRDPRNLVRLALLANLDSAVNRTHSQTKKVEWPPGAVMANRSVVRSLAIGLWAASIGCTAHAAPRPEPAGLRLLTETEYRNSIADIFD